MRGQIWYIALPIGIMCLIRFSLSAFGYAVPHWFMEEIGISFSSNPQMPYAIRAWAIRDIVITEKSRELSHDCFAILID